jgi:CheY-like chemotaxis protein
LQCVTADDGKEALNKLADGFTPDYIFMDLHMPGMNGIECMIRLLDIKHLKDIPVIIYTTSDKQRDILETAVLGAKAFITKPYDFAELSQKLNDFFHL